MPKKLKNFFKNTKKQSSGKKRKFVISGGLALSLVFGGLRLISPRFSSQNQDNRLVHERLISNEEFNLIDEDDQQPGTGRGQLTNFPVTPPRLPSGFRYRTPSSNGRNFRYRK